MTQKVIDTHVHFWDLDRLEFSWLEGMPNIHRTIMPADYPMSGDGWEIEQIVYVEASSTAHKVDEAEWVTSLAASGVPITGIVAGILLEKAEAIRPELERLKALPLVKGIRRNFQSEPPGFALQPGFIAGVKMLDEFDFTFDICIYHHLLPDAAELVRQLPNSRFVLDHIGKPDIRGGEFDVWAANLSKLAALPNVSCKVSGLVAEADWERWQPSDLERYITHVLECFGMDRVMYGTDFPVNWVAEGGKRWLDILRGFTNQLSASERSRLFYENGARFYGLDSSIA